MHRKRSFSAVLGVACLAVMALVFTLVGPAAAKVNTHQAAKVTVVTVTAGKKGLLGVGVAVTAAASAAGSTSSSSSSSSGSTTVSGGGAGGGGGGGGAAAGECPAGQTIAANGGKDEDADDDGAPSDND